MSRVEIIGECELHLGDMLDVVPTVGDVDMTCSDVPYLLTSGGPSALLGGKFDPSNYDNTGDIIVCDIDFPDFMPVIFAAMPRGHAYFMVNNRNVAACQNAAEAAGFHFHNLLTWDKGIATPNRWYMKNNEYTIEMITMSDTEFTVMAKTGKAFHIKDCGAKQTIKCPPPRNAFHDTQKPVALMEHYIRNSTAPGQKVLDPFMGSGTTGVAAVNLHRKFIGVEIVEENFDHACRRIEQAYKDRSALPMPAPAKSSKTPHAALFGAEEINFTKPKKTPAADTAREGSLTL